MSFRFQCGGLGKSLCVESFWSSVSSWLGKEQPSLSFPRLVPGRWSGYVLVLNLVSFWDFGLIFYLCSFQHTIQSV